jgi:hypothetical protein
MDLLSQKQFEKLANYSNDRCISIFIPTHRAGEETLNGKDAKELKSQLREISIELKEMGWHDKKIEEFLKPASELLEDSTFWRYNSDGLAIFLADDYSKILRLPIFFESYHYISKEFYIRPLLPLLAKDGSFYILSIGLKNINFYECGKHTITEIDVEELTPSRLEDTVGYDWEEKMVQFRSQQQRTGGAKGTGQATFHGHSGDKADHKAEILRYLNEVDKGIMNVISHENDPLLIACIDYMFPIYKEANTYPHLWEEEHISGNPADKDPTDLHREGWEILDSYFAKDKKEKLDLFHQFKATEKASTMLEDVVPAAFHGKVDTLFIQNREDEFGTFDGEKNTVHRSDEGHVFGENYSLLNLAAAQTIAHGGNVYLMDEEEMPDENSIACAYFRY